MKNNIIIAGVPRAGKSTISNTISKKYGYQHLSMDAIISGIESVFPELDTKWWPPDNNAAESIELFYKVSEKVALFIRAMLESGEYDEFEPGMVIDVFQLVPEHYKKYLEGRNCNIYYFLTSNISLEERFAIHRKYDTEKHYSHEFTDEEMLRHCEFVIERSKYLREQCIKFGLPYYETAIDREKMFDKFIKSIATDFAK